MEYRSEKEQNVNDINVNLSELHNSGELKSSEVNDHTEIHRVKEPFEIVKPIYRMVETETDIAYVNWKVQSKVRIMSQKST